MIRRTSMLTATVAMLTMLVPCLASADSPSRLVGTVTDFHGKYGLVVRDAKGRAVDVALHQGTIIKPVGLRLERGMQVTIIGQAADRVFAAVEIDTAYALPPPRTSRPTTGWTDDDRRDRTAERPDPTAVRNSGQPGVPPP
jgi:hypothetical protein